MARCGAESATIEALFVRGPKFDGAILATGKSKMAQIDPLHGLIWPRCKDQFSPNVWYQNSPSQWG